MLLAERRRLAERANFIMKLMYSVRMGKLSSKSLRRRFMFSRVTLYNFSQILLHSQKLICQQFRFMFLTVYTVTTSNAMNLTGSKIIFDLDFVLAGVRRSKVGDKLQRRV